jgi:hypothetical protein
LDETGLGRCGARLSAGLAFGFPVVNIDGIGLGSTTAPALTSCGTSPAIVGTDMAGTVTMGTTPTGCVITFNGAKSRGAALCGDLDRDAAGFAVLCDLGHGDYPDADRDELE